MGHEANVTKKVRALERRRAQLEALIKFIKTHPRTASEAYLRPLNNRPGLYFYDLAIIRPLSIKDRVILRLEKYTEDWQVREPGFDPFDFSKRTVCQDVSKMSDRKLGKILDQLHEELYPEEYEELD